MLKYFATYRHCLSFFLWTGSMLSFYQSDGNISFARKSLNMFYIVHNEFPYIFNIGMLILSCPWALFGLRFWIIFNMSIFTKFTVDKRLLVRKWSRGGSLLSFLIKQHCFAKKELKSSVFSLRSLTNLLWWNNGGLTGNLRLFKKIFNRAQYALVHFWIVFNFCDNLKKYFCFESSIRSLNGCCKERNFSRNWLLLIFLPRALAVLSFSLNENLIFPLSQVDLCHHKLLLHEEWNCKECLQLFYWKSKLFPLHVYIQSLSPTEVVNGWSDKINILSW